MKRAKTYSQVRRQARGGRAFEDAQYDRQRRRDLYLLRAYQIRSSGRWRRVRAAWRRREPLCRSCKAKGRTRPIDQVDHITSLVELLHAVPEDQVLLYTPPGAFDPENLQSLCSSCHAAKSREERDRA